MPDFYYQILFVLLFFIVYRRWFRIGICIVFDFSLVCFFFIIRIRNKVASFPVSIYFAFVIWIVVALFLNVVFPNANTLLFSGIFHTIIKQTIWSTDKIKWYLLEYMRLMVRCIIENVSPQKLDFTYTYHFSNNGNIKWLKSNFFPSKSIKNRHKSILLEQKV